jgi:ribonuclease P protein component
LPFPTSEIAETRVLFSVSKRHFKKATDRNLLKRRIRESYRLNKNRLSTSGNSLHLGFIYSAKEIRDFHFIEEKLILGLERLTEKLSSPKEHES